MNKEALIAIIIGVVLGLFGAVYFSNFGKPSQKPTNPNSVFETNNLTPRTTGKSAKLAEFTNLPKNNALLYKNTLNIKGEAQKTSHLFWANQQEIGIIEVSKANQFEKLVKLKPGLNEIVFFELNNDKEQLKVLKVFYFQAQNTKLPSEENQATKEADVLKEKLEDKVLELRNSPKRVVYGQIKNIKDKILTVVSGSETVKLTVEPEITNFYNLNGYSLQAIEFNNLETNDFITAFVSDIGGEEISYTVYQEPQTTIAAGKISNINDDDYQVTIIDYDKSSFGADVQVSTIQNAYNLKTRKIEEAGFSKLAIGQRLFAILSGTKGNYSLDEYLILQ